MQTAKQQTVALVKKLGGSIDYNPGCPEKLDFTVDAPAGKVWAATQTHGLVGSGFYSLENGKRSHDWLWRSVLEDIRAGLQDCTETDCEICEEEGE